MKSKTLSGTGHGRYELLTSSTPATFSSPSATGPDSSIRPTSGKTPNPFLLHRPNSNSHLKPGAWVEFQAIIGVLGCDDESIPEDSYLRTFSATMESGSTQFGASLTDPLRWKEWFEDRGYCNVTQRIFKLPFNPWAADPRLKLLGAWEMENLLGGLEAMVSRMFQKGLGWTSDEVAVFLAHLKKEIMNPAMHGYWP